jgi:hypothetical protein
MTNAQRAAVAEYERRHPSSVSTMTGPEMDRWLEGREEALRAAAPAGAGPAAAADDGWALAFQKAHERIADETHGAMYPVAGQAIAPDAAAASWDAAIAAARRR